MIQPKKALEDMNRRERGGVPLDIHIKHTMLRYVDHSFDNINRYHRYQHFVHLQYDQRFIAERTLFLGPDLAAAHFFDSSRCGGEIYWR